VVKLAEVKTKYYRQLKKIARNQIKSIIKISKLVPVNMDEVQLLNHIKY
jgi:hypothetical protein